MVDDSSSNMMKRLKSQGKSAASGEAVISYSNYALAKKKILKAYKPNKFEIDIPMKSIAKICSLVDPDLETAFVDTIGFVIMTKTSVFEQRPGRSTSGAFKKKGTQYIYELDPKYERLFREMKHFYIIPVCDKACTDIDLALKAIQLKKNSLAKILSLAGYEWVELANFLSIQITTYSYEELIKMTHKKQKEKKVIQKVKIEIDPVYAKLLKFLTIYHIGFKHTIVPITAFSLKKIALQLDIQWEEILEFLNIIILQISYEEIIQRKKKYQIMHHKAKFLEKCLIEKEQLEEEEEIKVSHFTEGVLCENLPKSKMEIFEEEMENAFKKLSEQKTKAISKKVLKGKVQKSAVKKQEEDVDATKTAQAHSAMKYHVNAQKIKVDHTSGFNIIDALLSKSARKFKIRKDKEGVLFYFSKWKKSLTLEKPKKQVKTTVVKFKGKEKDKGKPKEKIIEEHEIPNEKPVDMNFQEAEKVKEMPMSTPEPPPFAHDQGKNEGYLPQGSDIEKITKEESQTAASLDIQGLQQDRLLGEDEDNLMDKDIVPKENIDNIAIIPTNIKQKTESIITDEPEKQTPKCELKIVGEEVSPQKPKKVAEKTTVEDILIATTEPKVKPEKTIEATEPKSSEENAKISIQFTAQKKTEPMITRIEKRFYQITDEENNLIILPESEILNLKNNPPKDQEFVIINDHEMIPRKMKLKEIQLLLNKFTVSEEEICDGTGEKFRVKKITIVMNEVEPQKTAFESPVKAIKKSSTEKEVDDHTLTQIQVHERKIVTKEVETPLPTTISKTIEALITEEGIKVIEERLIQITDENNNFILVPEAEILRFKEHPPKDEEFIEIKDREGKLQKVRVAVIFLLIKYLSPRREKIEVVVTRRHTIEVEEIVRTCKCYQGKEKNVGLVSLKQIQISPEEEDNWVEVDDEQGNRSLIRKKYIEHIYQQYLEGEKLPEGYEVIDFFGNSKIIKTSTITSMQTGIKHIGPITGKSAISISSSLAEDFVEERNYQEYSDMITNLNEDINPELTINYVFHLKIKLNSDEAVYVSGSNEELSHWNIVNSVKLENFGDDRWIKIVPIKYKNAPFEYKYFVSRSDKTSFPYWIGTESITVKKVHFDMLRRLRDNEHRVMTFNTRYINDVDGINSWHNRKEMILDIFIRSYCDIIGLQEINQTQLPYFENALKGVYFDVGKPRTKNLSDEQCKVLYNHQKFFLQDLGQFWLSTSPTEEGSVSFGNYFPRMCTWTKFILISDIISRTEGKQYFIFNTHLDHISENSRLPCTKVILKHIEKIIASKGGENSEKVIFITGCFYSEDEDECIQKIFREGYESASRAVHNNENTYHEFTGSGFYKIDHIFYKHFNSKKNESEVALNTTHYEIVKLRKKNTKGECIYLSDHFPIYCVIQDNSQK